MWKDDNSQKLPFTNLLIKLFTGATCAVNAVKLYMYVSIVKLATRVPKNTYPVHADEHTLSKYCMCSNNCTEVAGVLHCTHLSS